jgi:phosphoglycolate phosphatase
MILICLDLDGTLEDSRADMTACVHRTRKALGLSARLDAEVTPHVNKGMDQLYKACFDDHLNAGADRLEQVRQAYEADYLAHVADETRLYPGVADALKSLSELGSLAVVTNKPEQISRRLLEVLGVGGLIGTVVGGDTAGVVKPDSKMLLCAAEDLGLKGVPSVMIGDTAADLKMGKAFGARTVWCAWGYSAEPGETSDAVARTPADLPAAVRDALSRQGTALTRGC